MDIIAFMVLGDGQKKPFISVYPVALAWDAI
jgi:hypothetical protein